jgi:hypothetical protein
MSRGGTIDRLTLIESTARFQVENKMEIGDIKADKSAQDQLLGPELTQVLVFLLKGSIAWYANLAKTGSAEIELPDKVKNTTKDYFNDHDSVSAWIEYACQKKGSEKRAEVDVHCPRCSTL